MVDLQLFVRFYFGGLFQLLDLLLRRGPFKVELILLFDELVHLLPHFLEFICHFYLLKFLEQRQLVHLLDLVGDCVDSR